MVVKKTNWIVNDANNETAAGTSRDVLTICELRSRNFEAVATRTWIVINGLDIVKDHIFDLNFVVVGDH